MTANKNNDDLPLHAVVFAGPNGSGKSSLIKELEESGLTTIGGLYPVPAYVINPDQVAKDLPGTFPDQAARDRAAFDAAIKLRDEAIQSGKPFAYETVMSHPSRINEMLRLKEQGYSVLVTFITTDNPDTNVARVKQRVETGTTTGHGVPEKNIRERYERTLSLLPKAAEVADAVFVYDNSIDWQARRPRRLSSAMDDLPSRSMRKNGSSSDWSNRYVHAKATLKPFRRCLPTKAKAALWRMSYEATTAARSSSQRRTSLFSSTTDRSNQLFMIGSCLMSRPSRTRGCRQRMRSTKK